MEARLHVSGLSIGIRHGRHTGHVVEDVGFHLAPGEILGLVGESGCGKSLTALAIAGLLPAGVEVTGGQMLFEGRDLARISRREARGLLGKEISMIFQEPMTALNPLVRVGRQVEEVLDLHTGYGVREKRERVRDMLERVGIPDPTAAMRAYPHQLSGGQRQRVAIAMAVILKPKLILADEPTTALDVTIQAQILDLLLSINRDVGASMLFISHDLGVISRLCDRVAVLYAGSVAETGSARNLFVHPVHPYTKGLLGAIPVWANRGRRLANIPGSVPTADSTGSGCLFAPRCPHADGVCFQTRPKSVPLGPEHAVACHRVDVESEVEDVRI